MKSPDFLPLGSVVIVKGSTHKMMTISRAVIVENNGRKEYFDYGGCSWPEGQLGDKIAYFSHDMIREILFKGYVDGDDGDEARMRKDYADSFEHVTIKKLAQVGKENADE
jgi:hypothetical protein